MPIIPKGMIAIENMRLVRHFTWNVWREVDEIVTAWVRDNLTRAATIANLTKMGFVLENTATFEDGTIIEWWKFSGEIVKNAYITMLYSGQFEYANSNQISYGKTGSSGMDL